MNPHATDRHYKVGLEERIQTCVSKINHLLKCPLDDYTPLVPHVWYYYYHSECYKHIDMARSMPDSIIVHHS